MRFITGLLPLVQNATGLRRVVSVLAGTFEGPIDLDNLACLGFPLLKQRDQVAAIHTLLLEEMKRRAPSVSFVHTVPGVVKSGITRDATGFGMSVIIAISNLMSPLISTSPDESGERHVFAATNAIYSPDHQPDHRQGVRSGTGVEVARGSNGQDGSGIYTVTHKGESSTAKEHLLDQFRKDGTAQKVWNMVDQDVQRITGSRMGA
ncbi:hypothetical protein N3K66_005404 [Trichothecium roseum]|uniref:Uncharacterized protein n=1 Tax=Trichothecium roseum TaxID=47278 RepID=A0ACC0UXR8_9HYPO|nr:hypothetical protein N3K66_005404 [Trichothecium roseum]